MTVHVPATSDAGDAVADGVGRSGRARSGLRTYDFRRPNKLSRDDVRLLHIAFETFTRQFATVFTTTLRTVAAVSLIAVEQLTYDEYLRTLETPSFCAVLSLEPLDGAGVLHLPLHTAMVSVDHLLGGNGGKNQPGRALTEIETGLVRNLAERALHELTYAFEFLTPLSPRIAAVESNPRFAQVAASSDMMVVASLELRIGSDESIITVCLPHSSLAPVLEAATAPGSSRDPAAAERFTTGLRQRLSGVDVEVAVRFAPAALTPQEIVDLQVGDIVRLPHPIAEPLAVTASGVTTAYAVAGTRGRRLACRIVPPPEESRPR